MSGKMGIAFNPFLDSKAGNAYMNFEGAQLMKFWTEIDPTKRERLSLGLLLEKMPGMISAPPSRTMTLGMNSPMVVPSLHKRATVERQQREFTDGWDPLFIGYSAAVYFHT